MKSVVSYAGLSLCICGMLTTVTPARAGLVLTQAGIDDGFSLTAFVSGYNFGGNYGPLSQAILPSGNVVTGSVGDGKVYVFNDTDGQTLASAVSSTPYACQTGNCNFAMATAGGQAYGAQAFGGVYEHFANDGSFTPIPNLQAANLVSYLGMWANPVTGHLISASNQGLVDIDPVAGTYTVINAGLFPDGVSVSPDGLTAYVENGGTLQSYSLVTGTLLSTFFTGHGPDGTGVIIGGTHNGQVIVNNNDGTVGLLDPTKPNGDPSQFVIIADGGTRGDFVSPDTSNGTLFLSQYEQVLRLSCGADCSIGTSPTPEPASLAMFGSGIAALAFFRRRKTA